MLDPTSKQFSNRKKLFLTAAVVVAGAAALYLKWRQVIARSLPAKDARRALEGLSGEVEILRDRWGVPHIYANDDQELFFAQGYVHAQDRLFQMDIFRRLGLEG